MIWNCWQIKISIYLMLKSELFHQNFSFPCQRSIKGKIFSSVWNHQNRECTHQQPQLGDTREPVFGDDTVC